MSVFIDTNVLLRSVQPSHPMHEAAVRSVADLLRRSEPLVITPQIVAEFWNVATRPVTRNGFGWPHQHAGDEVARVEGFCSIVIESAEVYSEWKQLVLAQGVTGVQAHDARLVAAMKVYGVKRILTFNTQDFVRYPNIEVIRPA